MSQQTLYFSSKMSPDLITQVHMSLLEWYAREQRDLPWRKTDDPYAILVSEIMLQQTQVERVLPKYQQFMSAFPTLSDLAAATPADVISIWVPLGYNRRAVVLHTIAQHVITHYDGIMPDTLEDLLKLKGVGRYTAGAIACFAFHSQVATVDTNIRRVLHRIFLGLEYTERKLNDRHMLMLAEQLLPSGEAYNWNQALMDFGATICTSSTPRCTQCPVEQVCCAYATVRQQSLFPTGAMIGQVRKVAEKKATYQIKTQPFQGSNRYFRGRIVDFLRSVPLDQRITLIMLGSKIKSEFHNDDLPWLQQVVRSLAKDGLVDYTEDGVRLPH